MRILRTFLLAVAATLLGGSALAQQYPSKPIEMVIPWPPGGRTDTMVRMLAPFLEKELGQPVVVVNKVGGGGLTGMAFIKAAPADGYVISSGGIALSGMQYQRKTDISLWDYNWFARVYSQPLFLAVPANSRFKSLKDFLAEAKQSPGKLKHGNTGPGSSTHIASEAMAKAAGVKITQVPYKGEGPAVVGLAGAETDFALGMLVALRPFIESNKIRLIAVAGEARDPSAPNVPTFREQGLEFHHAAFEALHVPKSTPQPIVDKLTVAARNALANPDLKAKFQSVGLEPAYMDGPAFTKWLRGWDDEMRTLIKEMGLYARE